MAFQEKDDDDEPVQGPSNLWSGNSNTRDWYSRGLVFDRNLNQTIEIKRIESNRTFKTKKQAEKYGLELCKGWIDKQS
jgi:hypothetical protein